jgi:thiol-disulfide isomerase/thioredoxin
MPTLINVIKEKVAPYSNYITIAWIVLIFTFASVIFYFWYLKNTKYDLLSQNAKFNNVANENQEDGKDAIILYFFYVDWCPYCNTALPELKAIKEKYPQGSPVNKYVIEYKIVNLTDTDDPDKKDYIKQYNIDSYPTVFIVDPTGKRIDYHAKVTQSGLDKFINSYSS